jgi:hypothetical protein
VLAVSCYRAVVVSTKVGLPKYETFAVAKASQVGCRDEMLSNHLVESERRSDSCRIIGVNCSIG